ncbi:BppU family phage baseplate upper protein, partial [Bacillus toyonensis]|uniref:BppU family phage baseplate upper protein n=1 Tax=Bacillus toyonensis TaxID=155322 RepID=UPI000BFABDC4
MAEIQFNVNMDLVDKYTPAEDITIPQEDNLSVKFTYSIFNREVAEDLTGATDIVVSYVKPDGHIVLQSNGILVLPNKVNIVANAQAFTYVGKVYMQVQYKKDSQTFNTRQAFFWVERSGTSCTTVASSDYAPYLDNIKETWTLLSALDLQALIDSKQTAENAQADVDALTPRVTTLETNYTALASRVTAVEGVNTTQNTRLTNLENGQTTQDNRLTAIESKNTSQDTKISTLETSAADIPTMKTDITAIKGVNTTQDNRLSALETAKTANDAKNATQDTNIGNNATAISGLQTSQAAQDTKITNLESYQTSSNTRITAVETK